MFLHLFREAEAAKWELLLRFEHESNPLLNFLDKKIAESKPESLGLLKGEVCSLVLGAVFEDARELEIVEVSLGVDGSSAEELVHFFFRELVAHRHQQFAQLVFMYDPGRVFVEASKGVPDNFLRVCSVEALAEEREEHGEVDRTRSFVHHRLQVLFISFILVGHFRKESFSVEVVCPRSSVVCGTHESSGPRIRGPGIRCRRSAPQRYENERGGKNLPF